MSVPCPREVQEFQFKLLCRLRVFDEDVSFSTFPNPLSVIATASKYGLILVSHPKGICVIQSEKITQLFGNEKKKPSDTDKYPRRIISLPSQCTHVDVSCDNKYAAVCCQENGANVIQIYDVTSFLKENIELVRAIRVGPISSISWNPAINTMLAACLVDGSAVVYDIKNNGLSINSVPAESQSTCLCWSPKGKQIVIGSQNGQLSQFKPELTIVKIIKPPGPLSVVSVQWLSNIQYAVVYKDNSDNTGPVSALYIVNTPKAADVVYTNYDDICYSTGNYRSPQFYLLHQQIWNVLLVASGTSIELGVLGFQNNLWEQWIQEDQSRAELPLRAGGKGETFPLGMALDTSVQFNLPIGENQMLPPMPLLYLMSNEGLLSMFFVVNTLPSAAMICHPPETVPDLSGLHHFEILTKAATEMNKQIAPSPWASQPQAIVSQALPAQVPSVANSTPTPAPLSLFGGTPKISETFTLPGAQVTITPIATSGANNTQPSSQAATVMYSLEPSANMFTTQQVTSSSSFTIPSVSSQATSLSKSNGMVSIKKKVEPAEINLGSMSSMKPNLLDEISEETKEAVPAVNDALIMAAIAEEVANFNSDLEELKQLNRNFHDVHKKIGLDQDKQTIDNQIYSLETFFKELKNTTSAQKSEVHLLKNALLENVNWVEDAKSKDEMSRDPHFKKLVKSQDLDPIFKRKMAKIEQLMFYLESQIEQVNSLLDESWSEFKSRTPKETIKVPSLQTVYQTLVTLDNVLHKQRSVMEDIEQKLEKRQRKKSSRMSITGQKGSETTELAKLAQHFLKVRLNESPTSCIKKEEKYIIVEAGEEKLSALESAIRGRAGTPIKSPRSTKKSVTDSMSLLSLISKQESNVQSPAKIKSNFTYPSNTDTSAVKNETTEIKNNFTISSKLETPIKQDKLFTPKSVEIKVKDKVQTPTVLTEVKNNVISHGTETPVKSTDLFTPVKSADMFTPVKSADMFEPKNFQTDLFVNKENKPSPETADKSKSPLTSLTTMVCNFTETLPKISPAISTSISAVPKTIQSPSQFDLSKTVQSSTPITTTSSFSIKNVLGSKNTQSIFSVGEPSVSPDSSAKSIFGGTKAATNLFGSATAKSIFSLDSALKPSANDVPTSVNIESTEVKSVFTTDTTNKVLENEIKTVNIFGSRSISIASNIGKEITVPKQDSVATSDSNKPTVFTLPPANTSNSSPSKMPDIKDSTKSSGPSIVETVTPTKQDKVEDSTASLFKGFSIASLPASESKPVDDLFSNVSEEVIIDSSNESKPSEQPSVPAFTEKPSTVATSAGTSLFGDQAKVGSTSSTTTSVSSLGFGSLSVSPEKSAATSVPVTSAPFSFSLPQSTTAAASSTFSFAQAASTISSSTTDDKNSKMNLTFGQPSSSTSLFGGFSVPATTAPTSSAPSTASQTSFTFALPPKTTAQTHFFANNTNVFGSAVTTPTNSFFGQSSPATTSVFGQATSSPFASSSGFGAKPTFGQSGGSLFGQSPSGGFGSGGGTSMFGGGSSVFSSSSGGNVFQTSGSGSIFGGGSTAAGGSFSAGGQSVSQSGFGSPPAFQNKLGGFGAAPSFGASPSSAFGSPPSFGSNAAFTSPSKVFGSPNAGGFGAAAQQPTGFESLASQNTMSFGNLAQNQSGGFVSAPVFGGTQQQSGFASPSSSSNFSGTSFNSWR